MRPMTSNPVSDLLVTITALMGGALALATMVGKVIRWWNQGKSRRVEHADDWVVKGFKENIAVLKEENARCWAQVEHLRVQRQEHEKEIERLEERHRIRREEAHELNNQLQVAYMMIQEYQQRFGHLDLDENGKPK
jgi:septal ring factor EnvC (AmiA/AmiB activator)